jgi:ribonucleoside-triphosphate reductase
MRDLIENKKEFIQDYVNSANAADGSKYDANANITSKNICTLQNEMFKKEMIKINRSLMGEKIKDLYGEELAEEYIRQLENNEIYTHDETSIMPYRFSAKDPALLVRGWIAGTLEAF